MAIRKMAAVCGLLLATTVGACAHGGPVAVVDASPAKKPANERTRLYAACARASDAEPQRFGRYVRLTCKGDPARALFDAAQTFSGSRGRENTEGGRTTRRLGAEAWFDACTREGAAYACFVHLLTPAGFLDPENDVAPASAKPAA